jgi:hypothetical protein
MVMVASVTFPPQSSPHRAIGSGWTKEGKDHGQEAAFGGRGHQELRQADVELANGDRVFASSESECPSTIWSLGQNPGSVAPLTITIAAKSPRALAVILS